MSELCSRRPDHSRIRVQGDATRFRDELLSQGVKVLADDGQGEWRVEVPPGWTNLTFFKLAAANEAPVFLSLVEPRSSQLAMRSQMFRSPPNSAN